MKLMYALVEYLRKISISRSHRLHIGNRLIYETKFITDKGFVGTKHLWESKALSIVDNIANDIKKVVK